MPTAPVSIVIPTLDPSEEYLAWTLSSLAAQTTPPGEVIIVDVTPGGFPHAIEGDDGCVACGDSVASAAALLQEAGVTLIVHHEPGLGLSEQRRFGIAEAEFELAGRFDEDTVLLHEQHIERCVQRIDRDDDVVAVGCRVEPIDDNAVGKAIAGLLRGAKRVPVGLGHGSYEVAYFVIHETHLCPDGEACFPVEHRDGDQHLKAHLAEHGRIVRDPELAALTELPTRKQARAMRTAGATAGGGLAGTVLASLVKGGGL